MWDLSVDNVLCNTARHSAQPGGLYQIAVGWFLRLQIALIQEAHVHIAINETQANFWRSSQFSAADKWPFKDVAYKVRIQQRGPPLPHKYSCKHVTQYDILTPVLAHCAVQPQQTRPPSLTISMSSWLFLYQGSVLVIRVVHRK